MTKEQLIEEIKQRKITTVDEIEEYLFEIAKTSPEDVFIIPGIDLYKKAAHLLSEHGAKSLFPENKGDDSSGSLYHIKHLPKVEASKPLTAEEIFNYHWNLATGNHADDTTRRHMTWVFDAMHEFADVRVSQQNTELKASIEDKDYRIMKLENAIAMSRKTIDRRGKELEYLREILEDKRRLTKQIDVILNGKNAAENPSLCDVVKDIESTRKKLGDYEEAVKYTIDEMPTGNDYSTLTSQRQAEKIIVKLNALTGDKEKGGGDE